MRKSISELGNWTWTDPVPVKGNSSNVEREYYRVHRIPICDLEWSDISFLIGQEDALEQLVPLAISYLEDDIFVEVEYYNGDLLNSLFRIGFFGDKKAKPNYWDNHPKERQQLIDLYTEQVKTLKGRKDIYAFIKKDIAKAYEEFIAD